MSSADAIVAAAYAEVLGRAPDAAGLAAYGAALAGGALVPETLRRALARSDEGRRLGAYPDAVRGRLLAEAAFVEALTATRGGLAVLHALEPVVVPGGGACLIPALSLVRPAVTYGAFVDDIFATMTIHEAEARQIHFSFSQNGSTGIEAIVQRWENSMWTDSHATAPIPHAEPTRVIEMSPTTYFSPSLSFCDAGTQTKTFTPTTIQWVTQPRSTATPATTTNWSRRALVVEAGATPTAAETGLFFAATPQFDSGKPSDGATLALELGMAFQDVAAPTFSRRVSVDAAGAPTIVHGPTLAAGSFVTLRAIVESLFPNGEIVQIVGGKPLTVAETISDLRDVVERLNPTLP